MNLELEHLIFDLEKRAKVIKFPHSGELFNGFHADLKRAIQENCGRSVANSLAYDNWTQLFEVRIRETSEVAGPYGGTDGHQVIGNFIFEVVKTITPWEPLAPQIEAIVDMQYQIRYRFDLLTPNFTW